MSSDAPPTFDPVNIINLISPHASKISSVSLYSGRAEITRVYKFAVKTGQNQVKVSSLPDVMDQDTLRVEGRGAATIHGVTIARTPPPPVTTTSAALTALTLKKERVEKALNRCKKSLASLETYIGTLSVERVDVDKVATVVQKYDTEGERLDNRLLELEAELKQVEDDIKKEKDKLAGNGKVDDKLGLTATIGVFADHEADVEIVFIYAVRAANWSAAYDIRVNMQTKEKPVNLIYKAMITQTTGEAWEDVPLTLETVTPTFGVGLPYLGPWFLSVYRPPPPPVTQSMSRGTASTWRARKQLSKAAPVASESDEDLDFGFYDNAPGQAMAQQVTDITSKGNLSTTFRVPGLISVPSDSQSHYVTIVQLQLDADMSWISIPRVDTRVHLKAKVKNASEYTLLPGGASVYVDGSFISKSNLPSVSPQESFNCSLGLDPSIRVTYHPLTKKSSRSGFYNKICTWSFLQRVTVHNTKSTAVDNLKIIDHVPISEDSQITVKLINPMLIVPPPGTVKASSSGSGDGGSGTNGNANAAGKGKTSKVPPSVQVQEGIQAQWDGADEPDVDVSGLGKDGKFNWVCTVPPQGKVNLALQWEVSSPVNVNVAGL